MDSPLKAPLPKVIASARLPHPEKIRIQKNKCPAAPGKVNIVLVTDSRYVTPTAVSMYSAIKNKCPQSTYNFYVVAEEITRRDVNMLLILQKKGWNYGRVMWQSHLMLLWWMDIH